MCFNVNAHHMHLTQGCSGSLHQCFHPSPMLALNCVKLCAKLLQHANLAENYVVVLTL